MDAIKVEVFVFLWRISSLVLNAYIFFEEFALSEKNTQQLMRISKFFQLCCFIGLFCWQFLYSAVLIWIFRWLRLKHICKYVVENFFTIVKYNFNLYFFANESMARAFDDWANWWIFIFAIIQIHYSFKMFQNYRCIKDDLSWFTHSLIDFQLAEGSVVDEK